MSPTPQVLLDNFLGAFPYDISNFVRWTDGLSWFRGTPDEQSAPAPGTLTIALDNTDGRFSFGSGTYGIGTDQKIRVIVNGVTRWTGRVQSWPVAWPTGGQEFSVVTATAVDDLARASRFTLAPALVQEILKDNPSALYQLSEDDGATLANDFSGNQMPSLAITGTGTPLAFGAGTGPVDGLSCVQFNAGTFLRGSGADYIAPASAFTVECFFATTMTSAFGAPIVQLTGDVISVLLFVTSAGKLQANIGSVALTTAASVNDGLVHHAAVTCTAAGVMNIYLDGVGVGVTGAGTPLPTNPLTTLSLAPTDLSISVYTGTIAHVAVYTSALNFVQMAAHAAAVNDFVGETPAARLARVAGYMGLSTSSLDTSGTTTMGPANQEGRTGLDVITEVVAATQGVAYVNGSGALTSRNGYAITSDTTPTLSIDANFVTADTEVEADMAQVVNYIEGKRTGSENTFPATNAFSLAVHGKYPSSVEWNVATDDQARDRTNWLVRTYAGTQARIPTLTLDLMSLSGGTLTNALALEVGGFLHVTGLPSQTPQSTTADLIILGISETVTAASWTLTLNCVKHSIFAAWILGDAFWGNLNATTTLYF